MTEIYEVTMENGKLVFSPSSRKFPLEKMAKDLSATLLPYGYLGFCNMGNPDLLECRAYRADGRPGGLFIMLAESILFIAHTESQLVFTRLCGHFASQVADVLHASDIWEDFNDL